MQTNRDLYLAIGQLIERRKSTSRPLEEYLRTLWNLACSWKHDSCIKLDDFFRVLDSAFEAEVPEYDAGWADRYCVYDSEANGFDGWETTILSQIVDLRDMKKAGMLSNEMRYFGVQSPRGGYWYNFDPCSYLECAVAGSLGGWQEDDPTGREYVPGLVAVLAHDGTIESKDPRDIENPIIEIAALSWDQFRDFLWCGQNYE